MSNPKTITIASVSVLADRISVITADQQEHCIFANTVGGEYILSNVLPLILSGQTSVEVPLENLSNAAKKLNAEEITEALGSSFIKFLRVNRSKILEILQTDASTIVTGEIAEQVIQASLKDNGSIPEPAKLSPIPKSDEAGKSSDEVLVGVAESGEVLTHLNGIEPQLYAAMEGNGCSEGVRKFFERILASNKNREYPLADLVEFIKNSDLPIAADGSVVAFREMKNGGVRGDYFDWYSNSVRQNVGYVVRIDPELCDQDRSRDCSSGLHIGSRNHLKNSSYSEDMFVCSFNPEDVVAVPSYDATKIRVERYRVLEKLSHSERLQVKHKGTYDDIPAVTRAIHCQHPLPIKMTSITKDGTKVEDMAQPTQAIESPAPIKTKQIKAVSSAKQKSSSKTVSLVTVQLKAIVAKKPFTEEDAKEALAIKRKAKKSWTALGLTAKEGSVVEKKLSKGKK